MAHVRDCESCSVRHITGTAAIAVASWTATDSCIRQKSSKLSSERERKNIQQRFCVEWMRNYIACAVTNMEMTEMAYGYYIYLFHPRKATVSRIMARDCRRGKKKRFHWLCWYLCAFAKTFSFTNRKRSNSLGAERERERTPHSDHEWNRNWRIDSYEWK